LGTEPFAEAVRLLQVRHSLAQRVEVALGNPNARRRWVSFVQEARLARRRFDEKAGLRNSGVDHVEPTGVLRAEFETVR
jgi:hypothetical protein